MGKIVMPKNKNWRTCVSHAKDHCCNDAYDSISGNATG